MYTHTLATLYCPHRDAHHTLATLYCPRRDAPTLFLPRGKHHRDHCHCQWFPPVGNTTATIAIAPFLLETLLWLLFLPRRKRHHHPILFIIIGRNFTRVGQRLAGDQRCELHPLHFSFVTATKVYATLAGRRRYFTINSCRLHSFIGQATMQEQDFHVYQSLLVGQAGGPTNTHSFDLTDFDDTILQFWCLKSLSSDWLSQLLYSHRIYLHDFHLIPIFHCAIIECELIL